jgi:hypothetical protein
MSQAASVHHHARGESKASAIGLNVTATHTAESAFDMNEIYKSMAPKDSHSTKGSHSTRLGQEQATPPDLGKNMTQNAN